MTNPVRLMLLAASTSLLISLPVFGSDNAFVVSVANGPMAGTYKPAASEVFCFHSRSKRVLSAAWKDFNVHDSVSLAEAGVQVDSPDAPGAKHGIVRISFGDSDKNPKIYQIFAAPLTLTMMSPGAEIRFDGATKEGIKIRITISCASVDEA